MALADVRVSWVEFDSVPAPADVRLSWIEFDVDAVDVVIKPPVYVPGSAGGRIVRDSDLTRLPRPGKTRRQRNNEALLLAVLM